MRGACRLALIGLLVAAALSFWSAAPARAETASLVRDLETAPSVVGDSWPRSFFAYGGKGFFLAWEQSTGHEVWASDGTAQGTEMLVDACPGTCNSTVQFLGGVNGYLFWISEKRLWASDGTRAGTQWLTGGETPFEVSSTDFAVLGRFLYFHGCRPGGSCDLWRSDGTPSGTERVLDTSSFDFPGIGRLAVLGNKIYFYARSESDDSELWVSDGTSGGTGVVRSFSLRHGPGLLTAAGGRLFFIAGEDLEEESDDELWVSDGTAAGTRMLSRFPNHNPFSHTEWLKAAGNQIYFLADDVTHGVEIWKSDGTEAGTVRVTEFGAENPFGTLTLSDVALAGSRLVFRARDGLTDTDVWATSGTPESTVALAAMCVPPHCNDKPDFALSSAGSRVLFVADDGVHGRELWASDGTPAGTALVRDLCPGDCHALQDYTADPTRQLFTNGFFVAAETPRDDFHTERRRMNLWRSDGTAAGTRRWTDISSGRVSTDLPVAAFLGDKVLFSAQLDGGDGVELWTSDGRPGGTRMVADLQRARADAGLRSLTVWGDRLAFVACAESQLRLWLSSGTAESTQPLPGGVNLSCTYSFGDKPLLPGVAAAGANLFYWQIDPTFHQQLWRSDGTAAGTRRLLDVDSGSAYPFELYPAGERVFFRISRGGGAVTTYELWRSDGTAAGTLPLVTGLSNSIGRPVALGNAVYFIVAGGLWTSDGTAAGTRLVASPPPDVEWDEPLARAGSWVYFIGSSYVDGQGWVSRLWKSDGTGPGTAPVAVVDDATLEASYGDSHGVLYFVGRSVWRTDGTPAGTVRLRQLSTPSSTSPPATPVPLGDSVYFAVEDGEHGVELWKTDGTAAGTALVRDVFPGPAGSNPSGLIAAGGALYFTADDGDHGFELWKSDGTAAGTRLVQDIAPGPLSSAPAELRAAGGRLYFIADDGLTGRELWTLPLGAGQGCAASSTRLCLAGGRFAVEASWKAQGRFGTGTAVSLSADTGYFWFFGPDNVEVILKVLDGRGVNDHHWVFYGALSDVSYTLTVTDTQSGAAVRYSNVAGQLASVADTQAFGPLGAFGTQTLDRAAAAASLRPLALAAERIDPQAATGTCQESASRLCLNGGRFAVEASWKAQGRNGTGTAVGLTGDTGYFWFFGADNVEVVLKVLDGSALNGKFWVFYGALSDVEYMLTVADTQTGTVRTYANPAGRMASVADTSAF